jgi:methanogenic corrinoid protein MtbC1/DNA-binding XRE family transcriptional regulator
MSKVSNKMALDTDTPLRQKRYLDAVRTGDGDAAAAVIDEALANGILPSVIYLRILMQTQSDIGELWHSGEVSLAEEQVAIQLTIRETSRLRGYLKSRVKLGLRATVTTIAGDTHVIGARAVADFLAFDGWDVDFLGAGTPATEIARYAHDRGARLVCLSMMVADYQEELSATIAQLRNHVHPPKILIGGAAFRTNPELVGLAGADGYAGDAQEAVNLGRQLCGLLSTENALPIYLRKFGQNLHQYRKLRGMSQQELADSAELDRAYISSVEHGKQNISIGAIARLAGALKISIEELLAVP